MFCSHKDEENALKKSGKKK